MTDTNNTDGAALLPVTQSDREAAAKLVGEAGCCACLTIAAEAFARHRQSHSLPATQEDAERSVVDVGHDAIKKIVYRAYCAGFNDRPGDQFWNDREAGFDAAIAALSTPQRQEYDGEAVREALADVFAAWDAHVEANDRTNAAIPAIDATRAERAVYDERYRASEEAKREWYRAMHRFIENPAARAALAHPAQATPSALSGDAGEE